jgi:hypothetical protein
MLGKTVLLPAGLGLLLAAIGFIVARNQDTPLEAIIESVLFALSGFLIAASLLIDPAYAGWLHDIRAWNLFGTNIMLACFVWSAMATWYEAFRKETSDQSWHAFRTPFFVFAAGLSLPLWSLHGMTVWGAGVILWGAAWMVSKRTGKNGRKVACVLAALGAAGIGVKVVEWTGGFRTQLFMGVSIVVGIMAITGTLIITTVWKKEGRHYHPWRGPVYVSAFVMAFVVAVGIPAVHVINDGASHAVTTASKVAKPGNYGNPFDLIAHKIAAEIMKHSRHTTR